MTPSCPASRASCNEALGPGQIRGHEPRHHLRFADGLRQDAKSVARGTGGEVDVFEKEAIEVNRGQWKGVPQSTDFELAAEATHRRLERMWTALRIECDRLPIEHQAPRGHRENSLHDLGTGLGHVVRLTAVDAYLVLATCAPGSGRRRACARERPLPRVESASETFSAVWASIGWMGRKTSSRIEARPDAPSSVAIRATSPRSPESM